ncbi:TetR/AcrR family transcriptional regulator [Microbacterium sp. C7(2022)]|uniref:TetR/AcrR family transcriptional regulator n=1 Tax=Microbacterium sp. C7(2022) TaxID=2992759 RepID=UPI00237BD772|nr:TetR/AcrR family transcriptional regulator [Microbacterium sp. C7(2022)]MDE0545222.1 TetR/AcrR family transcriptional regulator [Microbacterium sp. C7(2022)]
MSESARSLREQRVVDTARALRSRARELTAERGIHGFTVEELCTDVGVSRRTFFNYFATKENAVLGVAIRADLTGLDEQFVTGSGTLVDDLADLMIARWDAADIAVDDFALVAAAVERSPELHRHFLENLAQNEREDMALVARREGIDPDDDRATAAVFLMGAVMRPSVAEVLRPEVEDDFATIFRRRLEATRGLLAPISSSTSNGKS